MTEEKLEKRLKGYALDTDGRFSRSKRLNGSSKRDGFLPLSCRVCRSKIDTIFLTLPCECFSTFHGGHGPQDIPRNHHRQRNVFDKLRTQEIPPSHLRAFLGSHLEVAQGEATLNKIHACPVCDVRGQQNASVFDGTPLNAIKDSSQDWVSMKSSTGNLADATTLRRQQDFIALETTRKGVMDKLMRRNSSYEERKHVEIVFPLFRDKCALCQLIYSSSQDDVKICQFHSQHTDQSKHLVCLERSEASSLSLPLQKDAKVESDWEESIFSSDRGHLQNVVSDFVLQVS